MIQFTPAVRALEGEMPEPFMRARLIAVSDVDNQNYISLLFDFNSFEEHNRAISAKTFPNGVCTIRLSLFRHHGDNQIDFFTLSPQNLGERGNAKPLDQQLRDLILIAEMFELYDAADYLRGIVK